MSLCQLISFWPLLEGCQVHLYPGATFQASLHPTACLQLSSVGEVLPPSVLFSLPPGRLE